jgi:hypothetical protein
MSVKRSLFVALTMMLLAAFCFLGCEGDQGPPGPPGLTGPEGPDGQDRQVPVPDDRMFSLAIMNASENAYRSAGEVELVFDPTEAPTSAKVVGALLETPPVIDGVDGGSTEWGNASAATISLPDAVGADNSISNALIRAGYNMDYFFMQISWTEVATGDFVVAADTTKNRWTRVSATRWQRSGQEDQLVIGWGLDLGDVGSVGCKADISVASLSESQQEIHDYWRWQATVTNYTGRLRDMAAAREIADGPILLADDDGVGFVLENVQGSRPLRMLANGPTSGTDYPLWSFEAVNYIDTYGWVQGATIPGYLHLIPAGSLADVQVRAGFEGDTWTVELMRKRNTGDVNDEQF